MIQTNPRTGSPEPAPESIRPQDLVDYLAKMIKAEYNGEAPLADLKATVDLIRLPPLRRSDGSSGAPRAGRERLLRRVPDVCSPLTGAEASRPTI